MINQASLQEIQASGFSKHFCRPLYGSYCFSRIPATIYYLLTGEKKKRALPQSCFPEGREPYDHVILLFLDGFGWRFFERYAETHPFLKRFVQDGIVSKIFSQFPSTTAAHVTSIHTGLEVGQSGIYEWFHYEPLVDRIIAPLLFSFSDEKVLDSLFPTGISTEEFFPFKTIYQDLHSKKIESYVFQHESICHSPYSRTLCKGAHPIAFFTLPQALADILEEVEGDSSHPSYSCLYFADIDSMGHRKGVDSQEFEKTILTCLDCLEDLFLKMVARSKKKTAILVTADHGMVEVSPKTTLYLNQTLPELRSYIKSNRQGKLLVPSGSCRDFFLHIQEEKLQESEAMLKEHLKDRAEVYQVKNLIANKFFGEKPVSKRFLDRVGNLVILPYEGEAVWWYEKHKFEQHFYAAHGGLTRNEMETIFLFLEA